MIMEMNEVLGDYFILNNQSYSISHLEKHLKILVHSKSAYEVIRVEEGIPLFVEDYLDRLVHSMKAMQFEQSYRTDEILATIAKLIAVNHHRSGPVKLMLSAGSEKIFVAYLMHPHVPATEQYKSGVDVVLFRASREHPGVKIWNREMREKSSLLIKKSKVYEALLVEPDKTLTEASRSSIFFVRDGQIYTTPVEFVLPGITRKKVIKIGNKLKIPINFQIISLDQLHQFDACFLTGTARKIVLVRRIDDIKFEVDNPMVNIISSAFEELVSEYLNKKS